MLTRLLLLSACLSLAACASKPVSMLPTAPQQASLNQPCAPLPDLPAPPVNDQRMEVWAGRVIDAYGECAGRQAGRGPAQSAPSSANIKHDCHRADIAAGSAFCTPS